MLLATFAIIMPIEWLERTHTWLGLGEFPGSPLVEYLTRSISVLYAVHGGILLHVSYDISRFAPLIRYLGVTTAIIGGALLCIDIYAGLPTFWVIFEGPPVILIGLTILGLLQAIPQK